MPCPYAERRGALVFCKAQGKPVNPLAFPCLTERYANCRFYREAESRRAREAQAAPKPPEAPQSRGGGGGAPAQAPARPRQAPAARAPPRTRGMTSDGRPARSCRECVFYSEAIGVCLLLGVKVENPDEPPCAST